MAHAHPTNPGLGKQDEAPSEPRPTSHSREHVVLAHGLWMSGYALLAWRKALREAGYTVHVFAYPTVRQSLDQNAKRLKQRLSRIREQAAERGQAMERLHLVGHSLGGLLILHTLASYQDGHGSVSAGLGQGLPELGRVVLCGSPINGSFAASHMHTVPLIGPMAKGWLGRSITQWHGVDALNLPPQLPLGCIAGTRAFGLGRLVPHLPKPNDGTVALSETSHALCKDHLTLPLNHSELLFDRRVSKAMMRFFETGNFG